jgi:hypothetical protein
VDAACREVGRDPATLQRTASILVDMALDRRVYEPWVPYWDFDPLSGPPEEIAEELRRYAVAGISHVQLSLEPMTLASVEAFAPVLERLDR